MSALKSPTSSQRQLGSHCLTNSMQLVGEKKRDPDLRQDDAREHAPKQFDPEGGRTRARLPSARAAAERGVAARVPARPHGQASGFRASPSAAFLLLGSAMLLAGCAATQTNAAVAPAAPGFLLGLWHGFIFPVAWIVSLFMPDVAIYAVPNNGGWYDFGYFLGIVVFGVGARKTHTVTRTRIIRTRG